MKNIKIELGQEWQYFTWCSNKSIIINDISREGMAYGREGICMHLKDGKVLNYNDWTYLGTPVICEDCNDFCRQQCLLEGKKYKAKI